jgi:predicted RNA-binding protein associated with RNAse of E/G family
MRWREVSQQEYQEAFRTLRRIISLIEHDPRISGVKGFELKQQLREVARTLVKVEKEIYGEIWGLDGSK